MVHGAAPPIFEARNSAVRSMHIPKSHNNRVRRAPAEGASGAELPRRPAAIGFARV